MLFVHYVSIIIYYSMSVSITYFVHGTTTDNETGRATGWLPGELSEVGIEQAKELGHLVSDQTFDAIFCSDLKRAVDSAEFGFGITYDITPDPRLRECNYGDKNGTAYDFENNLKDFIDQPFPNGECYKDVEKRMADFLVVLKEHVEGKHIAIVAHQAPQLALDVLLRGKSWEEAIDEDWRKTKSWKPGWEYTIA